MVASGRSDEPTQRLLYLSPLAGRGRRALARRVRGPLRKSELVERPPHPDPRPASGEREQQALVA